MKLKTLTLAAVMLCINVLFGAPLEKDHAVIAKIDGLSNIQNVEIHDLLKHDSNVQVINSCQLLGIIVFKSMPDKDLSVKELEAYVQVKLKSLAKSQTITFLNGVTMNQVNVDCRAEVAKINNSK